jgi:hypothetical protein
MTMRTGIQGWVGGMRAHSSLCPGEGLPGDLLTAHLAVFECVCAVKRLFASAASEAWDVNLLFDLEHALSNALDVARPVDAEFASAGPKCVEPQYNGQPIRGCSAHAATLALANLIRVGCWAAGDLRGLTDTLATTRSAQVKAVSWQPAAFRKRSFPIDYSRYRAIIENRQAAVREYLRTAKPPNVERLFEALCIEAGDAATKRGQAADASCPQQVRPTNHPDARIRSKPQSRRQLELRRAWKGATRLLAELERLQGRKPPVELPFLLRCFAIGNTFSEAIALAQLPLQRIRGRRPVEAAGEKRETASALILALWGRLNRTCDRCGIGRCYKIAVSLMPRRCLRDDGFLRRFDTKIAEAVWEASRERLPGELPGLLAQRRNTFNASERAWLLYEERLRRSREFWQAAAAVDYRKLQRRAQRILDFDPVRLRRELEEEFVGPLNKARRLPKKFRCCSSTKMRAMFDVLWENGSAPVGEVRRATGCSSVEALFKQKDRANSWLAKNDLPWEIKKQGDTLAIVKLNAVRQE